MASAHPAPGTYEDPATMLQWAASPLCGFDYYSPEGSNLSFTMTSPPPCVFTHGTAEVVAHQYSAEHLNSSFSPSIFSPTEKTGIRLPKKRDVYRDPALMGNGIAGMAASAALSPVSRPESRNSVDMQALALLESPHIGLWGRVQDALGVSSMGMGSSMHMGSSSNCSSSSSAGKRTSPVFHALIPENYVHTRMQIDSTESAEPAPQPKGSARKSKAKKSPGDSALKAKKTPEAREAEPDMEEAEEERGTAKSRASKKKKAPYVSPDSSLDTDSSASMVSADDVLGSPDGAVEVVVGAIRSSKFGVTSATQATPSARDVRVTTLISTGVRAKTLPLETYDLAQHYPKGKAPRTSTPRTPGTTVCNCKKSKCLKLYCDCFAVLNYCDASCNCHDCCNSTERESVRQEAIRATKDRNAFAFQTKINEKEQHSTGCHCKNSACLKKYCECFTGAAFCGTNCKCQACLNFSGSEDLAKARSNNREDGSSRKRKESPSSVAFVDSVEKGGEEMDVSRSDSVESSMEDDYPKVKTEGAITPLSAVHNGVLVSSYSSGESPMDGQAAKRHKGDNTPLETRRRTKKSPPSAASTSAASASVDSADKSKSKKQVKFNVHPLVYPFFGPNLPEVTKVVALKVLECCAGKDIYSMSQLNSDWNTAVHDDAIWD